MTHLITDKPLTLKDLESIVSEVATLALSDESREKIIRCREYLDRKLADASHPIYGINTAVGSLYNRNIRADQPGTLQENLAKSHACGTGNELPTHIVRPM